MSTPAPSNPLSKLEFYQRRSERRTFYSRIVLLAVIFGVLGVNMWLTDRNYQAVIINIDQTRLAQAELQEQTLQELMATRMLVVDMQRDVKRLQVQLDAASAEEVAAR